MKKLGILLVAVAGSCAPVPPNPEVVAQQQAKFAELTAGKVAGPPMNCIPSWRRDDMVVIDDSTLAFRNVGSTVYVNHMHGPCIGLEQGRNTLVTKSTSADLCRGDIAQVIDTAARVPVGSCVFGDFVPYNRGG